MKGMLMFTQFLKEEDGAQVIEYALIIAMISIGLVLALQPLAVAASFGSFISRFSTCMTTGPCV